LLALKQKRKKSFLKFLNKRTLFLHVKKMIINIMYLQVLIIAFEETVLFE
jgi:hypothetical protein